MNGPELQRAVEEARSEHESRLRASTCAEGGTTHCCATADQRHYFRSIYRYFNQTRFSGILPADIPVRLSSRMKSALGHMLPGGGEGGTLCGRDRVERRSDARREWGGTCRHASPRDGARRGLPGERESRPRADVAGVGVAGGVYARDTVRSACASTGQAQRPCRSSSPAPRPRFSAPRTDRRAGSSAGCGPLYFCHGLLTRPEPTERAASHRCVYEAVEHRLERCAPLLVEPYRTLGMRQCVTTEGDCCGHAEY